MNISQETFFSSHPIKFQKPSAIKVHGICNNGYHVIGYGTAYGKPYFFHENSQWAKPCETLADAKAHYESYLPHRDEV